MASLDRVSGQYRLYIGGMFSLKRKDQLRAAGITHVLSVARMPFREDLVQGYKHLQVEVDDVEDENLLQYFPKTNQFIQDGLKGRGGVFVHCVMGKSRSATCVIAFLMKNLNISPDQGLQMLQRSRPLCDPNDGFVEQLRKYHSMSMADDVEAHPIYQRWMYEKKVKESLVNGEAPGMDYIVFEDEKSEEERQEDGDEGDAYDVRCRKCRRILATSTSISTHTPSKNKHTRTKQAPKHTKQLPTSNSPSSSSSPSSCAHIYTEPLSWMRRELEKGNLAGRLECPGERCAVVVGRYAWHGQKCSCGAWMVPAFALARSRVDEARKTAAIRAGAREAEAKALNIRMPPTIATEL